ncbi:MAG: hypothetical protein TREMPRED_004227, partial [Tremellales sp. Tagirdzhanova-0007]
STSYAKIANIPIPPQQPLSVFPVQFNWPPLANSAMNGTPGNGPPSAGSGSERIAIDPVLSSVRSSAAQHGGIDLPNVHLPDETLASAAVSPGSFDAAMLGAAKLEEDDDGEMLSPGDGTKKDQPFSRSPELRVSHKIAERKRRKEMKDLFDELRELLPAERGTKSSKWEILSKSIDFVSHLKNANGDLLREVDKLHREVEVARGGTEAFQQGAYHPYQISSTYPPPGPYPPAGTGGSATATHSPTIVQQGPVPRS